MLTRHVGLVSQTSKITPSELNIVAAALQKQVTRDFGPIWGVQATVSAYTDLKVVPSDYWPVIMKDDIQTAGAAGVHEDNNGQPFALVQYSPQWSLTASHETLEMLGDPFGKRIVGGQSPKAGQGRVNFLVEVCDPSEDAAFAYTVNGVTVSDFYTPHFFDPVASAGVRYSYQGAIKKPRSILKGGYLSWIVPQSNEWFQQIWFGPKPTFRSLGVQNTKKGESLRAWVDSKTITPQQKAVLAGNAKLPTEKQKVYDLAIDASEGRGLHLVTQVKALCAAK